MMMPVVSAANRRGVKRGQMNGSCGMSIIVIIISIIVVVVVVVVTYGARAPRLVQFTGPQRGG
jgi:uncharacterized membrane protein